MDLRKLRHASVLASEKNFARAARRLHITQPALTKSIQALEAEIGMNLFDRLPGGLEPTPVGRMLLERADTLLHLARGLEVDMALARDARIGKAALGMGPLPAGTFLADTLTRIVRDHPGLGIHVEIAKVATLLEMLHRESIEFFVADLSDIDHRPTLTVTPLTRMDIGFFVRVDHALAARQQAAAGIDSAELPAYPLATASLSDTAWRNLRAMAGLAAATDTQPAGEWTAIECDDINVLKSIVMSSDAVLMTAHRAVVGDLSSGRLVKLDPGGKLSRLTAQLGIVTLSARSLSPTARLIVAGLHEAIDASLWMNVVEE